MNSNSGICLILFSICLLLEYVQYVRFTSSLIMGSTKRCCKLSARDDHIHNLNPAVSDAAPELPFEIITEILSWLPVEALQRFKCVCKKWLSLLSDYKFIAKHMIRARPLQLSYESDWEPTITTRYDADFKLVSNVAGLLLEESPTSGQLRIRNFAMHQVLYLPDPPEGTGSMSLVFNSSNGECKVAGFREKRDQGDDDLGIEACVEVLSIGKDDHWRTLKVPNRNHKRFGRPIFRGIYENEEAAHMLDLTRDGECWKLEVHSFDLWSECFTMNTLPREAYNFLDMKRANRVIRWYQYLAVAGIVGEALNVMVLQDFKEHEWSKITVPLKFLKQDPDLKDQIEPENVTTSEILVFENAVRNNILVYDSKREMITATLTKSSTYKSTTFIQPSFVTLKGMKLSS